MKLRTAIISVVVSGALVAGAGYGAYYTMQGGKQPVEVVPVSNVNAEYWGSSQSVFGTVTSRVAQTVQLNEEYKIEKIFVKEGDEVKEGDALFSYDMTLQELELEMEQLSMQTQELTMTKLQRDLEKLKNTTATASLERHNAIMTAASAEAEIIEEVPGENEPGSVEDVGDPTAESSAENTENAEKPTEGSEAEPETKGAGHSEKNDSAIDGSLQIEKTEEVATPADGSDEAVIVVDSVVSYERLVLMIETLFRAYGDDLRAAEVGSAVEEAVAYYRRNLADEKITTTQNADGSETEIREYVLKDSVRTVLGAEDTEKLEIISQKLDTYQVRYVDMLIRDTAQSVAEASSLPEALSKIQASYDQLTMKQRSEMENGAVWQELKEKSQSGEGQEVQNAPFGAEEAALGDGTAVSEDGAQAAEAVDGGHTKDDTTGAEDGQPTTDASEAAGHTAYDAPAAPEAEYVLTILDRAKKLESTTLKYKAGDTVLLSAVTDDPAKVFEMWEVKVEDGQSHEEWEKTVNWEEPDTSFAMPPHNLTVEAVYTDNIDQIDGYINTFTGMVDMILAEGAKEALEAQGKDFATELENAVVFYQQWLGEVPAEILSTTFTETNMNQYQLRQTIAQYLDENNNSFLAQQMVDSYKQLCIKYTRALFDKLDPQALVREDLEKAAQAYKKLGEDWRVELEARWQEDQTANAEQAGGTGMPGAAEGEGQASQSGYTAASIGDLLEVYNVFLLFQEYQKMDPKESAGNKLAALEKVQKAYLNLTGEQKIIAAQNTELVNALTQHGMWEDPNLEPESEPEDMGYDDDFGGYGDDMGYTASELKELIDEKEREIKECSLDIRSTELSLKEKQRIVDGKIVRSTLDGTIVSIGTEEGDSEDDYFVKVTNQTGLYAKASMNELSLEKIHVGDTISGMLTSNGASFTAVVKEISEYPDPDGSSMSFGSENSNASYYPFYAQIENAEDLEEGEAEIQFSDTLSTSSDGIYLEKYFVRTENDGKPYVFMQGEGGKLKKQYIEIKKLDWLVQVVSGLEASDKIAFPYGKNVQEGAETKEVDMLEAYM